MLSQSEDTPVPVHRWWKTIRGCWVRKPHITHCRAVPTSPSAVMKGRESTSTTCLFCLFTFRITPYSSWTMFQCVLLCFLSNRISMRVVSGRVWLTHARASTHTHSHSTFPLCQRSPLPFPPPLTKHRRTAKGNFKVAGGGTPFFLALVII